VLELEKVTAQLKQELRGELKNWKQSGEKPASEREEGEVFTTINWDINSGILKPATVPTELDEVIAV